MRTLTVRYQMNYSIELCVKMNGERVLQECSHVC